MTRYLSAVCYIERKRQKVRMRGVVGGWPKARSKAGHEESESSESREQLEGSNSEGHMDAAWAYPVPLKSCS